MSDIWISKYRPKNIKEIIGNTTNIDKLDKWINNDEKNMSLVISGTHFWFLLKNSVSLFTREHKKKLLLFSSIEI